jgi:hypothetical protein
VNSIFTLEIDESLVTPLDHDGFVGGLVAFEFVGRVALVADESLLTLQHQDGPEIVDILVKK